MDLVGKLSEIGIRLDKRQIVRNIEAMAVFNETVEEDLKDQRSGS